jgi:hypothetical protein
VINVRELSDKLLAQEEDLRQTFDGLLAAAADGSDPAALAKIVAEGLAAIHERQRTAILITAQIP